MAKKEELEAALNATNQAAGFGAGPRYVKQKNGTVKSVGKGFKLDYAYGNVALGYTSGKGLSMVSSRMSKSAMLELLFAMRRAFQLKRGR